MNIFEILTIFDWITPTIESVKDANYAIAGNEPAETIWLAKSDLSFAKHQLEQNGINVISQTWATFDPEAGLDIPQSQVQEARNILGNIGNW